MNIQLFTPNFRVEECLETIREFLEQGLILILDAPHILSARLHGRHVGHDADCTIFSFQAVKNLAIADSAILLERKNET